MDDELERELRSAMREDVDGVAAPSALAGAVFRRHRRRTRRLQVVSGAALAVLVVAALPVFREVVPGMGPARTAGDHLPTPTSSRPRTTPSVAQTPRTMPKKPVPHRPSAGKPPATRQAGGKGMACGIVGYLPTGLKLLSSHQLAGGLVCRWSGSGGAGVSVSVASPPASLTELAAALTLARPTTVEGLPAFVGNQPNGDRSVVWVNALGSSDTVTVTPSLGGQLMSIAGSVAAR